MCRISRCGNIGNFSPYFKRNKNVLTNIVKIPLQDFMNLPPVKAVFFDAKGQKGGCDKPSKTIRDCMLRA
jgi:hypothetical protein